MKAIALLALSVTLAVWMPQAPVSQPPSGSASVAPPPGGRGGGRGRGAVQIMALRSAAWTDGGSIPARHTQAGGDVSPSLSWTNAPENIVSFVLIVHDLDTVTGAGLDDVLHWLVWNIPGAARALAEHTPQGATLPDGSRQISVTGPNYRGPAAPASGPAHHYVFELFALDASIDVPAVGASPSQTRAAVAAAMAGHVRGKGVLTGVYKR
ncbi:MAG: YbhB/YbcL family Raf kinase inhibitor-like protein [Vicinamibacterales bacterium]